ncbi:hypothetical protein HAX54_009909, partial [Datura stramonium]|nr:hypothetical protein [Datura stramonium]
NGVYPFDLSDVFFPPIFSVNDDAIDILGGNVLQGCELKELKDDTQFIRHMFCLEREKSFIEEILYTRLKSIGIVAGNFLHSEHFAKIRTAFYRDFS